MVVVVARSAAALFAVGSGRLVLEETPDDEAIGPASGLFDPASSPAVRPPVNRSLATAAAGLALSAPESPERGRGHQ